MAAIESSLKLRIRRAGLTQKEVADKLNIPYGTLVSQLNGFSPLSYRREIEEIIREAESQVANA